MARCYFSFEDMLKFNDDGYFPYTPPTQLFHGLKASLALIEEEGLENIFARHYRLAEVCAAPLQRGMAAVCAPPARSGPTWCRPSWCPKASTPVT